MIFLRCQKALLWSKGLIPSSEHVVCFLCLLHIKLHLRLYFLMEANNMNPDQTAPSRSSLIRVHIVCINSLPTG